MVAEMKCKLSNGIHNEVLGSYDFLQAESPLQEVLYLSVVLPALRFQTVNVRDDSEAVRFLIALQLRKMHASRQYF